MADPPKTDPPFEDLLKDVFKKLDNVKYPMQEQWIKRHIAALRQPQTPHELALLMLLRGALAYADAHQRIHESSIGDDYVLGPYWAEILKGIRGLLNGTTDRFDCGTLDSVILNSWIRAGFTEEGESKP